MTRGPGGKQRWAEVLDGFAPVTRLALARQLAPEGIARLKNGLEAFPRPELPTDRGAYESVVADFIELYAKPRQRTWKETARVLNAVPWAGRPIAEITKQDAYALLDGIVADGHHSKAAATHAWLRKLWRWAARREIVDAPIMDMVEIEVERTIRNRVYSDDEIRSLWNASEGLSSPQHALVKLLMLLGVRKGELAGMQSSELDDPDMPALWTVPHERTKTRKSSRKPRTYIVPLPPLARRVLKPMLKDGLIFPSQAPDRPIDTGTFLSTRVRKASGVADWFPHAHRHTLATWAENAGASEYERALLLNHAGGGVTSGYSHGYPLDLKRQWLERWAEHVAVVVSPEAELLA
jgi:integrase